jgi:hypothetical protein
LKRNLSDTAGAYLPHQSYLTILTRERRLAGILASKTRRQFIHSAAFATAAFSTPTTKLLRGIVERANQNAASLDQTSLRKLASDLDGHLITSEESDYERARLIFNRAFDLHPALILRCASSSDVARGLDFAQTKNLSLAVHGGGHSRIGYGMCEGGVVIDLSAMRRVTVDPEKRVAQVQAGAIVRDLDEATQRVGLATTSGGCPTVGIAGFTLGGGEGRLMDKYGAACDNLLSAQVVTVDGKEVEASHKFNPDLFWAIRGGGGNFGVVTALTFQLHPMNRVLSGALTYAAGRIPELVQAFAQFLAKSPDEMDGFAQVMPSEHGPRFKIDVCYCGDERNGNDFVRSLRALKPVEDNVREISYLEAQSAGGFLQKPVAHFQTNLIVPELDDGAIAAITTAMNEAPTKCKIILVPLRGAISRVNISDTAFALRGASCEIDIAGVWDAPVEKAEVVRWVTATRDRLQLFAKAVYINQLGDTSEQLVRSGYGANYARLVEIKKKYDPKNVLRLNQNIRPDSNG